MSFFLVNGSPPPLQPGYARNSLIWLGLFDQPNAFHPASQIGKYSVKKIAYLCPVTKQSYTYLILHWLCWYWNSISLSNFRWEEYSYSIASSDLLYRPTSYSYMQFVRRKLTFRKNFNAFQNILILELNLNFQRMLNMENHESSDFSSM